MTIKTFTLFAFLILMFGSTSAAFAQSKNGEAAAVSNLLEVNLPPGAAGIDSKK